jgi:hypothetical protein
VSLLLLKAGPELTLRLFTLAVQAACLPLGLIATLIHHWKDMSSYSVKVVLAMVYQHEWSEARANKEMIISVFAAPGCEAEVSTFCRTVHVC